MEEGNTQFGMTQDDVKQANRQEIFRQIKSVLAQIGPVILKMLNTAIYYLIRLSKAFFSATWRMILGKEV